MSESTRGQHASQGADPDTLRHTQHLLSVYPFASATPTTHVARHLSSLTISAAPPSYFQPSFYSPPYDLDTRQSGNISALAASEYPLDTQTIGLWQASQAEALQLLGQDIHNEDMQPVSRWNPSATPSTFQPAPFAHSVLQHTAPYNAYPTPPPAPMPAPTNFPTSSSLANALGEGKPLSEPTRFFNDFLAGKLNEISMQSPHTPLTVPTSPQKKVVSKVSGPLRVNSLPATPYTPSTGPMTPKKRKLVEVVIETPTRRPPTQVKAEVLHPSTPFRHPENRASHLNTPTRTPKSEVYVDIPTPKNWRTPSKSVQPTPSSDLGGYGSDGSIRFVGRGDVPSTTRRTGERDERVPTEKFLNLLEDIFEAEDNIAPDADLASIPTTFFSQTSTDAFQPLLQVNVLQRVSKALGRVVRISKQGNISSPWDKNAMTPSQHRSGLASLEPSTLSRLFKLLERSVRAGEDMDPFNSASRRTEQVGNIDVLATPQKAKGNRRSKTPIENVEASTEVAGNESANYINFAESMRMLEACRNSILAADCCIHMLTCDGLDKQLFSEDLIVACLTSIKNQFNNILYPLIEAPISDARTGHRGLEVLIGRMPRQDLTAEVVKARETIREIFHAATSVLPRINTLLDSESMTMNDSIIIPAVYISIGPFFVIDTFGDTDAKTKRDPVCQVLASVLGQNAMRGLRLQALTVVRSIFAVYEDQRSWIIDEILSSLIRLSDSKQKAGLFRLRDGRSIRTVSALLMQLVQSASHKVRIDAGRFEKNRRQQQALRRQDSLQSASQETLVSETDEQESKMYIAGLDGPSRAAKAILSFLTQRSGRTKSTKNSNEQEYRTILDNLMSDLQAVLYWPEWPAAAVILNIICKYMITSLDDDKTSSNDNQASKSMALDHLGVVASRLRSNWLKWGGKGKGNLKSLDEAWRSSVDETSGNFEDRAMTQLIAAHQDLSNHLSKCVEDDQSYESARELDAILWGQELAIALLQMDKALALAEEEGDTARAKRILRTGSLVKRTLRDVWGHTTPDVFDNATQEEVARMDALAEQIGCFQTLRGAFEPILNVIIQALDAPPVFVRTKALRALSQILTVDTSLLSYPSVRRAVEARLLDSSPQVRDAAVELIGKYMIESPAIADEYYMKVAERIVDTGLGVRKRVVKLMRTFYLSNNDIKRKVDICCKLTTRIIDEDESVKELVVKTMEELWFNTPSTPQSDLVTIPVILGVCEAFRDRQTFVEELFSSIAFSKDTKETADKNATLALRNRFSELSDIIIDGMLDASDSANFTTVNCSRAVHHLVAVIPECLSSTKASALLSYLQNTTTPDEVIASDYILKIYRLCLPHLPKTATKFGTELQKVLEPMVLKPNAQGVASLPETVPTLCSVVEHITHDFSRLSNLLKSCNLKLDQFARKPDKKLGPAELRSLNVLVLIVALLGGFANFDRIREAHATSAPYIDAISKGPIVEHLYRSILTLDEQYSEQGSRGRFLQSLSYLFRAQPTLMTTPDSSAMMDGIFMSANDESCSRLLRLFQDFLVSESSKHDALKRESQKVNKANNNVNMDELVGNTQGFAESGVSSAIVQRYLNQIMDAVLSVNPLMQAPALDILSFTVKQGLAHPLTLFPVIIALETSPSEHIANRASALHQAMHSKHASMLNAGFTQACRKSFEYQQKLTGQSGQVIFGYRKSAVPTALLGRWYGLVREKRPSRQEFFRAILRVFEVKDVVKTEEEDVRFTRYMAENFACIDYRTQEEVLTVVKSLTRELAETGAQLVEQIAPGSLLAQLQSSKPPDGMDVDATQAPTAAAPSASLPLEKQICLARSGCILGMIMLLKAHLKAAYGLSEEKCQKFVVGKKSTAGDRPAVRRKDTGVITWSRMPYAMKPVINAEDVASQNATFLTIWHEDGATAEPEEDEWE